MVDASPYRLNPQRAYQPQRRPIDKPAHVLPSNQRNMFAKLLPIELQQPPPVP